MTRRFLLSLLALVLGASMALAEVQRSVGLLSATSTSATVTYTTRVNTLTIFNDAGSANEVYVRVFHCNDVAAAATTNDIKIPLDRALVFTDTTGRGYCAFTYITAGGETASIAWAAQ